MRFLIILYCLLNAVNGFAATPYDRIRIFVNDRVITKNEIEVRLLEYMHQQDQQPQSDQVKSEFRKRVTDLLIEEILLDLRADELNIQVTDEQLDAEIDHYREQNGLSQIEFENLLERRNISLTDFRNSYAKRMRRLLVINREIRSKIDISDEFLKARFKEGAGKTVRVRARHILLLLDKDADAEETEKVRNRIIWIKNQIESGESFREMADRYSQDPSVKNNHGDLGFFGKGDMVPAFSEVAFSLKPGVLSDPVRSPFGFHLIEVLERKEEAEQSFEDVRDKLYQQEYQKRFAQLYQQTIADLKKKAKIIRRSLK